MYKYILQQGGDINWMALFALLTFCFIFFTSIILVLKRNKTFIDHMSHLPLDDSITDLQNLSTDEK